MTVALGIAALALIGLLLWWWTLRPSNERDWSPEYAEIPRLEINGDEVTIHNFRNCEYRTVTDFTPRWETKVVHLSSLRGLDLFMDYWGSRHIAHTLLSFDFGDEGYVCTSIETRRERGEGYSAVRGFFRQYELCYLFGDERDLIRVRTNYRPHEDVYLYPLIEANPRRYRALFLAYAHAANHLREHPRWYHAALNNCTTNIHLIAQASGLASAWDWRILINGHIDELLYERDLIRSTHSFADTKAAAHINARARAADRDDDFSRRIREGV